MGKLDARDHLDPISDSNIKMDIWEIGYQAWIQAAHDRT
jgi:hypothetical protein